MLINLGTGTGTAPFEATRYAKIRIDSVMSSTNYALQINKLSIYATLSQGAIAPAIIQGQIYNSVNPTIKANFTVDVLTTNLKVIEATLPTPFIINPDTIYIIELKTTTPSSIQLGNAFSRFSEGRTLEDGTRFDYWVDRVSSNFEYYAMMILEVSKANNPSSINISSPAINQNLYENDTLSIAGTASDADSGNSVTVRYQINANTVRAIKAFVSDGTTLEVFSKQLRFSGGSLYDGDTLIASGLVDGVAHKLKVWATDDQGGTSTIIERDFYVVPNRAPSLTVNPPASTGIIDSEEIEITGLYNDMDNNTSIVSYRINGAASVQVATGTSGDFDFKIKIGQLKVGLNNIVVEVIDSYSAKTSRTIKLQKNEAKTEQLKSTARYKILPPLNTATGVVIWIRRDENLALAASISMTQAGEAESFTQMTKAVTAPVPNSTIVEDQFQYENGVATDTIILQLDMERSSLTASEKIHVLVGVID